MRSKSFIWILVLLLIPTMACGLLGGDDDGDGSASSEVSLGAEEAPAEEASAPVDEEDSQEAESAAEPAEQADVEETQPEPEASGGEKTTFSGTSNLDQFSSYRVSFQMSFDGTSSGQPTQGVIEMLLEDGPPKIEGEQQFHFTQEGISHLSC